MPIIVQPAPAIVPVSGLPPDGVVRAETSAPNDCPVLTRTRVFLAQQGVPISIEDVVRDKLGRPLDYHGMLDPIGPAFPWILSSAVPSIFSPFTDFRATPKSGAGVLRVKEILGSNVATTPIFEVPLVAFDPANGVVRAALSSAIVANAGIYRLAWGLMNPAGDLVLTRTGLLSVERSLFGDVLSVYREDGPPTLNEIRMSLIDSSAAENVLLDDVEFGDDQIVEAISRPIRYFNESPPPLTPFTTRDFPFKEAWLSAIQGYLLQMAAHNYRRNRLQTNAGGMTIDDKNKEKEYLQAAQMQLTEWKEFVLNKKVELNTRLFSGNFGSTYGRGY